MESGHAHNTYLLPKHYLEQSSTEELLNYLRSQGLPISGNDAGVCDFVDENGTPCWSVTVSSFVEHTADKRRLDALFVQFSGFEIGDIPLSQREVDDIFGFLEKVHSNNPELITPQHAYIWETLAYVYNSQGNIERMERCLRLQAAFQPGLTDAYMNLGAFLSGHGLTARAIRAYIDGLQVDPACEFLNHNLASLYGELGDRKHALQAVNEAILANPTRAINHKLKADILMEYGDFHMAIQAYQVSIPLFPEEMQAAKLEALLGLARALEAIHEYHEAVEALFDALDLDPKNVPLMAHMASIMGHKAGRWDVAKGVIDMALRFDDKHAPLWRLAADYYKTTGQEFSQKLCEKRARELAEGR